LERQTLNSRRKERKRKRKEKQMVVDATSEACLVHAPPHRTGGVEIFQILP